MFQTTNQSILCGSNHAICIDMLGFIMMRRWSTKSSTASPSPPSLRVSGRHAFGAEVAEGNLSVIFDLSPGWLFWFHPLFLGPFFGLFWWLWLWGKGEFIHHGPGRSIIDISRMQPPSSRTNAQWWNAFLHVLPSRTSHLFETYMTHMTTLYSVQFTWSFLSAIGWLVLRSWYVSTRLLKTTTFPLSWQTQQSFLSWPLAILRITLGIRPKIHGKDGLL